MIGIIGASGAVGRHTAAALAAAGAGPLRLGARRPSAVPPGPWPEGSETVGVDASDPASLARFSDGCTLLVNCAGPSYLLKDTVALAGLAAGADVVDVMGDDPVHESLTGSGAVGPDRCVVLSAGTVPGLAGLVPLWLAGAGPENGPALRMTGYAGGLEHATESVAADIVLSLDTGGAGGERFGHPLAAWRHGRRAPGVLRVADSAQAPYFPHPVALQPLLTTEVERLAARMDLAEADWYNVLPGTQVRELLTALPTLPMDTAEQRDAVTGRIRRAAEVDAAGGVPYYRLVFSLSGRDWARTCVVHCDSSYRLTGAVAALAALDVLAGRIGKGLHYAAQAMDPQATVEALRANGDAEFAVHHHAAAPPVPGDAAEAVEDGEL
ncbi:NAD(P)H-binding protein [Nocardiopsis tropica]|uniref:NAD(P)H-binding protein n=1 Tax=Nocardiopsis tropica TaxID=109330 RepID=A0ABU7KXP3_9ACTN|nr:NAD(P)H-binding protein [Nocardiopsis umidischolae]MEE2054076.1 NAD(P)H-binding protein [Nocardiopsis umidischolae]